MQGVKVRTTEFWQVVRSSKWLAGWFAIAVGGILTASPLVLLFVVGFMLAVVALSAPLWSWVRIEDDRIVVANGLWRRRVARSQITGLRIKSSAILGPIGYVVRSGCKPLRVLAFGAATADGLERLEAVAEELNVAFELPSDG